MLFLKRTGTQNGINQIQEKTNSYHINRISSTTKYKYQRHTLRQYRSLRRFITFLDTRTYSTVLHLGIKESGEGTNSNKMKSELMDFFNVFFPRGFSTFCNSLQ
jgi:hypothetical protein